MLLFWLCQIVTACMAYRVGDVDTAGGYPFTQASGLFWHSGELGALVHGALLVDVSNRGVRLVQEGTISTRLKQGAETCVACPDALCCAAQGAVLPQAQGPFKVHAWHRSACVSPQRVYAPDNASYITLSCDVLQGDQVLLVDLHRQVWYRGHNTYGALSYVLALGCMLSCLVGMSTASSQGMPVAFCGAVGTALLVLVHPTLLFATEEDLWMLWLATGLHFASALAWASGTEEAAQQAYFYCISVITTASYRSVEHPYTALLCMYLLVKQVYFGLQATNGQALSVAAAVQAVYLGLLTEYGLLPQMAQRASWPLYAGVVTLGTTVACLAWSAKK